MQKFAIALLAGLFATTAFARGGSGAGAGQFFGALSGAALVIGIVVGLTVLILMFTGWFMVTGSLGEVFCLWILLFVGTPIILEKFGYDLLMLIWGVLALRKLCHKPAKN